MYKFKNVKTRFYGKKYVTVYNVDENCSHFY